MSVRLRERVGGHASLARRASWVAGRRGRRLCSQPAAAGTAAPRPAARRHAPDRTRREGSCGSSESASCRCAQSRPVTRSQAHRPGGPQVDAPQRGRRLGRSGAPRGEAAAATGVCEVLAQGHARASSKRTAGRGGSLLNRLCLDAAPGCCSRPERAAFRRRRRACSFGIGSHHLTVEAPAAVAASGQQRPRGGAPRRTIHENHWRDRRVFLC